MAVLVATRFKVSRYRYLPRFLAGTLVAAHQARRCSGFLGGRLRVEPGGGAYWTLTVWESGRDMVAFRDTGVHAVLVPKLAIWAGEAVFGVWNSASAQLPDWAEVSRRTAGHPNFAPLEHPAPAHRARHFDPARRVGFDLPIPRPRPRARRPANDQQPRHGQTKGSADIPRYRAAIKSDERSTSSRVPLRPQDATA